MNSNGFAFVHHILFVLLQYYSSLISVVLINFMLILLIIIGLVYVGQYFTSSVTIDIIFVNFVNKLQGCYL